ncbi:hypothetical protein BC833DRAFT_564468 [Globomyces pollinis-pini]|nr:hypothetical protein BC833DRAFT_564468 [Globomyces pollinis-pini]
MNSNQPFSGLANMFRMLLIFLCILGQSQGLTIAIGMTFGSLSHVNTYFHASKLLLEQNHTLVFATPSQYFKFTKDFPHVTTFDIGQMAVQEDVMLEKIIRQESMSSKVIVHFMKQFSDNLETSIKGYQSLHEKMHVDLMLCDFGEEGCMTVAKHYKVRVGILSHLGFDGWGLEWYIPSFIGEAISQKSHIESFWTRTYNQLQILSVVPSLMSIDSKNQALKEKLGFGGIPKPSAKDSFVFGHSFQGFVPARPIPSNGVVFGPMIYPDLTPFNPELKAKLDGFHSVGLSVVYIAFGSVANSDNVGINDRLIETIRLLLRQSKKLVVLWSVTKAKIDIKSLLEEFGSRFVALSWVQQKHVLAHPAVKVFLTHGGQGSIHEAIYYGKPLVVCPLFGDQFSNAIMVIENGIGLQVRKLRFTPEELANKLMVMMFATGVDLPINKETIKALPVPNPEEWVKNVQSQLTKFNKLAIMNSDSHPQLVANAMHMIATVGYDHLIPADAKLSIFDRVPFSVILVSILFGTFLVNTSIRFSSWILRTLFVQKSKVKTD